MPQRLPPEHSENGEGVGDRALFSLENVGAVAELRKRSRQLRVVLAGQLSTETAHTRRAVISAIGAMELDALSTSGEGVGAGVGGGVGKGLQRRGASIMKVPCGPGCGVPCEP